MATRIPIEYLRALFLEWAMDPDMLYRTKSRKHKGLVVSTDTGYTWDDMLLGQASEPLN